MEDTKRKVLFCHGLESGPHGSKFVALEAAGYEVIAPDCRGMNLAERVEVVTALLREHRPLVVGSSYGGVTAVLAAERAGVDLPGMVLCAPALERAEAPNEAPDKLKALCPTAVVHGVHDDVIPMAVSERFVERTGAKLVKVDDDHRLSASCGTLVAELAVFG